MTIKSVQKVIKVGSSLAVTIPARDARSLGIEVGKDVISSISVIPDKEVPPSTISQDYAAFKKQYSKTLKNLAGR